MNREYVWKEATGKLSILDTKPNYNMTFHRDGKQIGVLDFNGPEMVFSGDMDESAKVFFDWIARSFKARLGQEREAEREAIMDEWSACVQSDLENGVRWLNEQAAKKWQESYPAMAGFADKIYARGETK